MLFLTFLLYTLFSLSSLPLLTIMSSLFHPFFYHQIPILSFLASISQVFLFSFSVHLLFLPPIPFPHFFQSVLFRFIFLSIPSLLLCPPPLMAPFFLCVPLPPVPPAAAAGKRPATEQGGAPAAWRGHQQNVQAPPASTAHGHTAYCRHVCIHTTDTQPPGTYSTRHLHHHAPPPPKLHQPPLLLSQELRFCFVIISAIILKLH